MKCLACAILTMYRCRFTTPYLDTGYCTKPGSGTPSVYTALLAVCMSSVVTEGSWHTLVVTVDTVVTRPAADPPSADQPCWPTAHTSDPPHTADDAPSINLSHTMLDIVVHFIFLHTCKHSSVVCTWRSVDCSPSPVGAGLYPVDSEATLILGGRIYALRGSLCGPVFDNISQCTVRLIF